MNKNNFRNIVAVIVAVFCILAFYIVAALTDAIAVPDIPASFLGAAAGAIITTVVAYLLLRGQSRAEELKEYNVAVFKDKSMIFKKFITALWNAWEDHHLSSEKYQALTSMFYQELMLYLNEASQKTIGNALSEMGEDFDMEMDDEKNNDGKEELRNNMVTIIDVLIGELHLGGKMDKDLFEKLDVKMNKARKEIEIRQRTTFKMLGIKKGTELIYKHIPSIICTTADEFSNVRLGDEILSISKAATKLNGDKPAPGFDSFKYKGKTLWEMRKEMEKK